MSFRTLTRRTFVQAGVLGALSPVWANAFDGKRPPFRISLAPWSLMRKPSGHPDPDGVPFDDYPMVAAELGYRAIEHDLLHFPKHRPDEKVVARLKKRCDAAGVVSTLILCGGIGDIADDDTKKRREAVGKYVPWLVAAKELGCTAIRVVCADAVRKGVSFDEKRKRAVDGITALTRHADEHELDLLIENHGGYTSDPGWLVSVIRAVDHPRCGVLADFTHWTAGRDRPAVDPYEGMKTLAPLTRSVSAHAYDFAKDGTETKTDYLRMMRTLVAAEFSGYVAVEYFGKALDRRAGSLAARKLLETVQARLAP